MFKYGDIVEIHSYGGEWDGVTGRVTGIPHRETWAGKDQPWYPLTLCENSKKPPGGYATYGIGSWPVCHIRHIITSEDFTPETYEID